MVSTEKKIRANIFVEYIPKESSVLEIGAGTGIITKEIRNPGYYFSSRYTWRVA
ncbi:hypothetical protein KKH43_02420 [Patescibacteria group bacterium]|nr:hypothetical protein [Patescibacteria group bacterium]